MLTYVPIQASKMHQRSQDEWRDYRHVCQQLTTDVRKKMNRKCIINAIVSDADTKITVYVGDLLIETEIAPMKTPCLRLITAAKKKKNGKCTINHIHSFRCFRHRHLLYQRPTTVSTLKMHRPPAKIPSGRRRRSATVITAGGGGGGGKRQKHDARSTIVCTPPLPYSTQCR